MSVQSNVVLMARVDDPVQQVTRATYSTVVMVEHEASDDIPRIVDMALELAPPMDAWGRY